MSRVLAAWMLLGALAVPAGAAPAASEDAARTLEELLQQTREARTAEGRVHREREQRFISERDRQRERVQEAEARLRSAQQRSEELSQRFDDNERALSELETELDAKAGVVGELFGVYRQIAGDVSGLLEDSLISAQHPERLGVLRDLAGREALPSLETLETLWLEMLREMTASGQVRRFEAAVVAADGVPAQREVVRIGPFTAVSADRGEYLGYVPEATEFFVLARQPDRRVRGAARRLADSEDGVVRAVLDPTRGSMLATLVQRPSVREYVDAGGLVARIIIGLAVIGFGVGIWRAVVLWRAAAAVRRQTQTLDQPDAANPLGRVLSVWKGQTHIDADTLQLQLDDAVLREVPAVERGLGTIKVLAAVGPLLGLLGTVTGMILTFQQITLFGTGDPQLMAGGISQALVTTVLGLIMAIPLVLMHSALRARADAIVQVLEEQSAGMVAELAERAESP